MSNTLTIGPFEARFGGAVPVWILQQMSNEGRQQSPSPAPDAIQSNTATPDTQASTNSASVNPTPPSPPPQLFLVNMRRGDTSNDVRRLQEFLRDYGEGVYPEGVISGLFGRLTYNAVVRFQERYPVETLAPVGQKKGTGFAGDLTRAVINDILLGKRNK